MPRTTTFGFGVGAHGKTSAALYRAAEPTGATLILAHGAGAPRTHPFMTTMAARIAKKGVDVVTFNFLYAEQGRRMPDRMEVLLACWSAALASVRARIGLPSGRLFIGGKSMGGRIATRIAAASDGSAEAVTGVVVFGYPLHPIGKPSVVRDEILAVKKPMLVVQGTRDELGGAAELTRYLAPLARARVHVVEGGDHSLGLGARAKANRERVLDEVASTVAAFVRRPIAFAKRSR